MAIWLLGLISLEILQRSPSMQDGTRQLLLPNFPQLIKACSHKLIIWGPPQ